ncbi:MAG: hypothetical protein LLG06_06560, partial [Desulfobacteraceae bacterium]|nr:hypothetical protein [Desulfobacteraceae bacterium]
RWPSFQKPTWDYMRQVGAENALEKSPERLIGIDRDPAAVRIAGENGEKAGVGGDITWNEGDFFEFSPEAEKLYPGLLVLNPPYGKRLEGGGRSFYEKLGSHLRKNYRGWQFAVLAASHSDASAMRAGPTRMWPVRHGGLHITVAFGRVPA